MTKVVGVLHGARQNVTIMSRLIQKWEKEAGDSIKFILIQGFHEYVPGEDEKELIKPRHWFLQKLALEDFREERVTDVALEDLQNSLRRLSDIVKYHKIDALVGFSQGGALVDAYMRACFSGSVPGICGERCGGEGDTIIETVKRAVIIGGYTLHGASEGKWGDEVPPVLIMHSPEDDIVPIARRPVFPHDNFRMTKKGHKVPQDTKTVKAIVEYLRCC